MTFMFASLGSGIACGVMGFGIALTGTMVFCLGAIILRFSPFSNNNEIIGELKMRVPKEDRFQKIIEKELKTFCRDFELNQLRFLNGKKIKTPKNGGNAVAGKAKREKLQEFIYLIRLKNSTTITALEESMNNINGLEGLQLSFQKQTTKL